MALMVPPRIEDAHDSHAERELFDALQRELSADFYCYHSKQVLLLGRRGAREGEIDFVVLHRELGLLALEVKGGGLWRDGSGRWFRTVAGVKEPLKKDPFAQARDNLHDLVALLEARLPAVLPGWQGKLRLPYGHAVCIPEVRLEEGSVPSSMARETLLDADALAALDDNVRAAMMVWSRGGPAVDAKEFKRFRKHVLHPALKLVPTLAGLFRREEAALARLTEQQARVLDVTAQVRRARVQGGAGTGKTVLAVEKARRLAAAGKRVCLLCYNRPLADAIERVVDAEELGELVTATTYHGLCYRAAGKLGRPFEVPEEHDAATLFWRERAPEFLLDAIGEGVMGFDAVIVDEAQDLDTEWWVTVEALVPETGELWVFFDPQQDIYGRAAALPEGLVPLTLDENCRATRRLRELCDALSGTTSSSPAFAPEGTAHLEIAYKSPAELRKKLEAKVAELCGEQGLHPEQLTILAPHTRRNSSLAGIERIAGHAIVESITEPGIRFSTARRFKGLESEVVIAIDQDADDPACSRVHKYVAASRARHLLIVFCKQPWMAPS